MARISLGTFNGYNSSYGAYKSYLDYDSMSRNGNALILNNARLYLERIGTGYTTNRLACCVGYNGGTNNILNNHTINEYKTNSKASYNVQLGTFSINTNGNFPFYVALKGTGGLTSWSHTTGTPLTWSSSISGVAPSAPSVPGFASITSGQKPGDTLKFDWYASSGGSNGTTGYRVDVKVGNGSWQNGKFWTDSNNTEVNTSGNALGAGHNTYVYFRVLAYSRVNGIDYLSSTNGDYASLILVPPPTVSSLVLLDKTQNIIKVRVSGSVGSGLSLSGYQFSNNNGAGYTGTQSSTDYTFSSLSSNTDYNLFARIVDSAGQVGTSSKLTVKTLPTNPVVNIPAISNITSSSVKVTASGSAQGGIKGYRFSKDGGTTWTGTQTGTEYTFSGLEAYTNYTFVTKIIDNVNQESQNSKVVRTLANNPSVTEVKSTFVNEEEIRLEATVSVPSVSVDKVEFKLDTGQWQGSDSFNSTTKKATKKYIDLLEEKEYNISVRVYNSEGTVSSVYSTNVTTLPGKFATITKSGQAPYKVHTYLIKPDGTKVKLTKRNFKIIKG